MSDITKFKNKINNIVTDLINEGTYEDYISLQNPRTCGEYTIFLEEELRKSFKKVDLSGLSESIFISHNRDEKCSSDNCPEIEQKKLNKKTKAQVCSDISIYYIRILNLLSSVFIAIDSDNNMCLRRLNALYKTVDDNTGVSSICNDDKDLYPSDFLRIEGMEELIKLYTIYDQEGDEEDNKKKLLEIETLKKTISSVFTEEGKTSLSNMNNVEGNELNETKLLSKSSILNNLEKLKKRVNTIDGNVSKLKVKTQINNNEIPENNQNEQNNTEIQNINPNTNGKKGKNNGKIENKKSKNKNEKKQNKNEKKGNEIKLNLQTENQIGENGEIVNQQPGLEDSLGAPNTSSVDKIKSLSEMNNGNNSRINSNLQEASELMEKSGANINQGEQNKAQAGMAEPDAPTETGEAESGMAEPNTNTPTEPGISEPITNIPTEPGVAEPNTNIPTEPGLAEPNINTPTEPGVAEPNTNIPTEPGEAEPNINTPTEPGVAEPGMEQPVNEPGMEQPVNEPGMEKPVNEPGMEQPVNEPGMEQPVNEPGMEQPVNEPGIENTSMTNQPINQMTNVGLNTQGNSSNTMTNNPSTQMNSNPPITNTSENQIPPQPDQQFGGKTKKKKRLSKKQIKGKKNKSLRKNRNKNTLKKIKGGAGFLNFDLSRIRNIVPFGAKPKTDDNVDIDPEVLKNRQENPKSVKDFTSMVKEYRTPKNFIKSEGQIKIDNIPRNLSKSSQCENNKLNVKIDKNDSNYRNFTIFLRSHDRIRQHIEKYTDQLIEVVDNIVSIKNKKYQLKNIDAVTLNTIEGKTRKLLLEYYTQCQQLFETSFEELVKAVNNSDIPLITKVNNNQNEENEESNEEKLLKKKDKSENVEEETIKQGNITDEEIKIENKKSSKVSGNTNEITSLPEKDSTISYKESKKKTSETKKNEVEKPKSKEKNLKNNSNNDNNNDNNSNNNNNNENENNNNNENNENENNATNENNTE